MIDVSTGEDPTQKIVLINPEIVSKEGAQTGEEGCLSHADLSRAGDACKKVTVRARDAKGAEFEMTGEDLLARAIQHETDHLHGTAVHQPHQPAEAGPDSQESSQTAKGGRVGLSRR